MQRQRDDPERLNVIAVGATHGGDSTPASDPERIEWQAPGGE
jgi:hypothetical protein